MKEIDSIDDLQLFILFHVYTDKHQTDEDLKTVRYKKKYDLLSHIYQIKMNTQIEVKQERKIIEFNDSKTTITSNKCEIASFYQTIRDENN